jgi:hypothetical protein
LQKRLLEIEGLRILGIREETFERVGIPCCDIGTMVDKLGIASSKDIIAR